LHFVLVFYVSDPLLSWRYHPFYAKRQFVLSVRNKMKIHLLSFRKEASEKRKRKKKKKKKKKGKNQ